MKQLFNVMIESEIVVLADSREEAEEIAANEIRGLSSFDYTTSANEMTYLPDGWDEDCLAFGDKEDRTIAELIADDLAPALEALGNRG